MTASSVRAESERLDVLLRELDAHPDPAVGERLHEVVGLLMQGHREALERVLSLAAEPALGGPALVGRLADDEVVAPVLLAHDVHPYPADVRLARALDRLRPQIAAHGCRARLLGIAGGEARVQLEGGARLSERSDLVQTIEARLMEVAPEVSAVLVEATGPAAAAAAPPLIQILRQPPAAPAGAEP
jgi:Fe-S cluster biogenesis protein NfuA